MKVFNFLDFFELFINDLVTSSDEKSFFFMPETIFVRENYEIFLYKSRVLQHFSLQNIFIETF